MCTGDAITVLSVTLCPSPVLCWQSARLIFNQNSSNQISHKLASIHTQCTGSTVSGYMPTVRKPGETIYTPTVRAGHCWTPLSCNGGNGQGIRVLLPVTLIFLVHCHYFGSWMCAWKRKPLSKSKVPVSELCTLQCEIFSNIQEKIQTPWTAAANIYKMGSD